jgi:hypothetical protein
MWHGNGENINERNEINENGESNNEMKAKMNK